MLGASVAGSVKRVRVSIKVYFHAHFTPFIALLLCMFCSWTSNMHAHISKTTFWLVFSQLTVEVEEARQDALIRLLRETESSCKIVSVRRIQGGNG